MCHLQVPGGAAGLYLLGRLHSLTDNPTMATSCYQAALMRDPLLWSAYEGLCQLGQTFATFTCWQTLSGPQH